ncbi:MAG: hypothetical protein ACHQ9S_11240 [Candidatus Binatia bacterium]
MASCLAVAVGVGQARAEYKEVPVANGGAIAGRVRVTGEIPVLPPQPVFKHQETCGASVPDQRLLTGNAGALRNVVVYLADVQVGKRVPRERPVTLDNSNCKFVPHVLSGTVGQNIEIHNSDPFLHDAQAWLGPKTLFNVAIPAKRTVRRPLAYAGLVHINCNVRHTWMHAYLFVAEHPYHTVSDEGGRFSLSEIPRGTYRLSAWHELLGSMDREITIESGKTTTVNLDFQARAPEAGIGKPPSE